MKPHEPYQPKLRINKLLIAATVVIAAMLAVMWIFHESFALSISDLMIYTGFAVLIITLTSADIMRKRENQKTAENLKKQREQMRTDDFSDMGIFFDDNER